MIRIVVTTFASEEEAVGVIHTLVKERLAACGTILPGARSIYTWQGKVEDGREAVVLLKTSSTRISKLQQRLAALHPYETPEIVTLTPEAVSTAYGAWVEENTSAS